MRPASVRFQLEVAKRVQSFISRADILRYGAVVASNLAVESGSVTLDRTRAQRGTCSVKFVEPAHIPSLGGGILSPTGYEVRLYRGVVYSDVRTLVGIPNALTDGSGLELLDESGGTLYSQNTPSMVTPSLPLFDQAGAALLDELGDVLRTAGGILPAGGSELVSMGVFPIQSARTSGNDLLTSVTGTDRSALLDDAKLEADFAMVSTSTIESYVETLVRTGVGILPLTTTYNGTTHPAANATHEVQTSRWEVIQQLATSVGYEAFFNGDGDFVWQPEPSVASTTPVWQFSEGPGGLLIGIDVNLDRGPAFNRVIATGSNADNTAEFKGVATDTNPSSPSYYDGPFGHKPKFYTSSLFTSDATALSAATAILAANLGLARGLDLTAVPNPALEPGDVVRIRRQSLGVNDELAILDSVEIGMAPSDNMTASVRARQESSPA